MNNKLTPPFGSHGLWTLKSPYQIEAGKPYTCTAIRSFVDLELMNINIYELYYKPVKLETSVFEQDMKSSASIVTLLANDGTRIYVPDTYIASYPNLNLGNYRRFILSCDLGTLPADTGLTHLTQEIISRVSAKFGRTVDVKIHTAPLVEESLSPTDIAREEANRTNTISDKTTLHGSLQDANKRLGELQGYVKVLERRATEVDQLQHQVQELTLRNTTLTGELQQVTAEKNQLTQTSTAQAEEIKQLKARIQRLSSQVVDLGGVPSS